MKLQKGVLPVLFITLLLDMVGIGMLIPIIPELFTDPTSASFMLTGYSVQAQYIVAGLLTAVFGFMMFLASPILGELSDIYGRKRFIIIGVAVLAISQFLFAAGIIIDSLMLLFVSRAVSGISAANFSIAQATIADVTEPHERARNFGLVGGAVGMGFIIGPFLGGLLTGVTGSAAVPFLFAGILGCINVLLVTKFLKETHHVRSAWRRISLLKAIRNIEKAFNDHEARPLYLAGFFATLGFAFYTSFISIFLVSRFNFNETTTGTYFATVGIWMIFAQLIVVRTLAKKYSDRTRLLGALPVLALIILIIPFVPSSQYLYLLMPFLASSFALISTGIPALVSKRVGKEKQGAALGINSSLQALSQASAPLVAGFASGIFSLTAAFIFGSFFAFTSFFIIWKKQ